MGCDNSNQNGRMLFIQFECALCDAYCNEEDE